jgi:hydrogenase expression/formation protein HypC
MASPRGGRTPPFFSVSESVAMCVAVPGKVIEIDDTRGKVDILGNVVEADLGLLDSPAVGDYVIVHAGFAIQRVEEDDARERQDLWREILAQYDPGSRGG